MTILIDADGCPVVDISVKIAKQYNVDCVILCDTSHVFERDGVKTVTINVYLKRDRKDHIKMDICYHK